jgi:signal transduction histidine kinase
LAEAALRYGRAEERAPLLQSVALARALDEAAADALSAFPDAHWVNTVTPTATVFADAEHFNRIIVNVVRNAAQACATGSRPARIEARACFTPQATIVEIVDSGPGVPSAIQAKMFEPFSASGRIGGTGLGLAIARELANAMGGDVALAATGPNGSVFAISLRAAQPGLAAG